MDQVQVILDTILINVILFCNFSLREYFDESTVELHYLLIFSIFAQNDHRLIVTQWIQQNKRNLNFKFHLLKIIHKT